MTDDGVDRCADETRAVVIRHDDRDIGTLFHDAASLAVATALNASLLRRRSRDRISRQKPTDHAVWMVMAAMPASTAPRGPSLKPRLAPLSMHNIAQHSTGRAATGYHGVSKLAAMAGATPAGRH